MELLLGFFSDLILFTAGLMVVALWLLIIVIVVDEIIDIVLTRNDKEGEGS